MKRVGIWMVVGGLVLAGQGVLAHEEHEHEAVPPPASTLGGTQAGEETLTGEVVDVFCYLSHGEKGLGKDHAGCAKKCIKSGLPVAIKVGDQLYLASMADHTAANEKLADLAAEQVTVTGKVMEKDGQHLIAITSVEKAH